MTPKEMDEALERLIARFQEGHEPPVEVARGWLSIVAATAEDLAKIDPDFTVEQVKEKSGRLVFFASPSSYDLPRELIRAFANRIEAAENEADRTCEICGGPGALAHFRRYRMGWKVLCDHHLGDTYVRDEEAR